LDNEKNCVSLRHQTKQIENMNNAINNITPGDSITFTTADLSQSTLTRKVISITLDFNDNMRFNVNGYNGSQGCNGMMVEQWQIIKVSKAK